MMRLRNISIYVLSDIDLMLTKGIAGRPKDRKDLVALRDSVDRKLVSERFDELIIKKDSLSQKDTLRAELEAFLDDLYLNR
ncbi:MAG: hypothetical protein ACI9P9_000300 [Patescibacteria group bacterium]|jgi:hypothetical protein